MRSIWNGSYTNLPEQLLTKLLIGSTGVLHLGQMAESALNQINQTSERNLLLALGSDMLLAAFEHDCLNASYATQVALVEKAYPHIPAALKPVLDWLAASYAPPKDQRYFMRLLERRETDKLTHFLGQQISKEPANPFWLHHAYTVGILENQPDWLLSQLTQVQQASARVCAPVPASLLDALNGGAAFLQGDWEQAASHYKKACKALPLAVWQEHMAESLLRLGQTEAASELLGTVLKNHPWQVNTLLRLYDVVTGAQSRLTPPEGKGVILFYTWNKDTFLNDALAAVCEGERCGAPVIVLDNGSTDNTPNVIAGWQEKMGKQLISLRVPVNIGAPAARNWLASLPQVREADWLAYMDDDAIVPHDWLLRMGTAMQAYPKAGVYGCKIVDMHNNMTIQSADFHLEPGEGAMDEGGVVDRRFKVTNLQLQCFDFGHFNYIRPCASCTGCCHLFRREFFDQVGGFDLRYSPSQYDDLEHDLRHAMKGQLPVYQGHLTVRHAKRTGKDAQINSSQMSNSLGNLMKLQMRYEASEFNDIMRFDQEQAFADVLKKWQALGQALG